MNILAVAIHFASHKHIDQVDKGGKAYIMHPLRIMLRLQGDEELMAIAVLHDVVEDCNVSFEELSSIGMTDRVVAGVKALTKQTGETYEQFIDRLTNNRDAMLVKREDLRDNCDLTRLGAISAKDMDRMQKYIAAFRKLDALLKT